MCRYQRIQQYYITGLDFYKNDDWNLRGATKKNSLVVLWTTKTIVFVYFSLFSVSNIGFNPTSSVFDLLILFN